MGTSSRPAFFETVEEALTYQNNLHNDNAAWLLGVVASRNAEALPVAEAALQSAVQALRLLDPASLPGADLPSAADVADLAERLLIAASLPTTSPGGLSEEAMLAARTYQEARQAMQDWRLAREHMQGGAQLPEGRRRADCVAALQAEIGTLQATATKAQSALLQAAPITWRRKLAGVHKQPQLDDAVARELGLERLGDIQTQIELASGDVQAVHRRLVQGDDSSKLLNRLRSARAKHVKRLQKLITMHNATLASMPPSMRPTGSTDLDPESAGKPGILADAYWALSGRPAMELAVVQAHHSVARRREQVLLSREESRLLVVSLERRLSALGERTAPVTSHAAPAAGNANVYHVGDLLPEDPLWSLVVAARHRAQLRVHGRLCRARVILSALLAPGTAGASARSEMAEAAHDEEMRRADMGSDGEGDGVSDGEGSGVTDF